MENKKPIEQIVAENLTYYRKASGLTQLEVAEKFNYSDKSVSKWERGESLPDVVVLKALADFYNIKVDDFFKEEKQKTPLAKKHRVWFIVGLSAAIVWLTFAIAFVALQIAIPNVFPWWVFFVYATIGTGIVGIVWAAIYHNKLYQMVASTIIIWSTVGSVFLTLFFTLKGVDNLWLIFLIGIPLQAMAILWFFLRRGTRKKIKKTTRD